MSIFSLLSIYRIPLVYNSRTPLFPMSRTPFIPMSRKAVGLEHLCACLFKNYNFNSIENLSLVSLWNYIYKLKFNTEKYTEIKFSGYLKQIIHQLALLSPNLKLESQAVLNVIEVEQGAATNHYVRRDDDSV